MKLHNKNTDLTGEMVIMSNGEIGVSCTEATFGYESLSEFISAGWEDYEEKQPLIKDEKIRKAIRAWAEANNITDIIHRINMRWVSNEEESSLISFENEEIAYLDETHYTITELCGEE